MLNWTTLDCYAAQFKDRTYRVYLTPGFVSSIPYCAVVSRENEKGQLFEHRLGYFTTAYEAKKACENDAKE